MGSWGRRRLLYCLILFGTCCTLCILGCSYAYSQAKGLELASPEKLQSYLLSAQILSIVLSSAFFYLALSRDPGNAAAGPEFRLWVETSTVGLAFINPLGILSYANPTFLRMFRLTRAVEESASFEAVISHYLRPEDGPRLLPRDTGEERVFDLRPPAGQAGSIRLWVRKLPGEEMRWVARTRSTTEEWTAGRRDGIAARIPDISMDAIMAVDVQGTDWPIVYVNAAFEEMTGYAASEVVGQSYRLLQGRHPAQQDPQIRDAFEGGKPANLIIRGCRRDGSVFNSRLRVAPVHDSQASANYVVGVFRDLTHVQELEARLERSVGVDPVTLLPNRVRFKPRLDAMLLSSDAEAVLVLQFNIRRFQEMAASNGDVFCNALLVQVAGRLSLMEGAAVARMGDSEFAVALPLAEAAQAGARVAELARMLGASYVLPGSVLDVGFSIGYTAGMRPSDGDMLLRQAGLALLKSQAPGMHAPQRFDAAADTAVKQRSGLMRDLQQALGSGEFVLNYQPRVDLLTGGIVGAEALLRWHHPVFGLQSPDRFIAVVEETGLILEIGAWAIGTAAEFAVTVNHGRDVPLLFSINLSPGQFRDPNLLSRLDEIIARTGADPAWLSIEVTESVFSGPPQEAAALCRRLRERGFGLAIDDFATACSSLRQLDAFPLTEMKVDVSFVREVHCNRYRQTVIEAAVVICRELGVTVTAEGIESGEERQTLQQIGCRYGQGYLFSLPLAAADFSWLLENHPTLPAEQTAPPQASAA